jgi:hypothetical protein
MTSLSAKWKVRNMHTYSLFLGVDDHFIHHSSQQYVHDSTIILSWYKLYEEGSQASVGKMDYTPILELIL